MKVEVQAVKRELNAWVDDLEKIAAFGVFTEKNKMSIAKVPTNVSSELEVEIAEVNMIKEKGRSWINHIVEFLKVGKN